jgi:hypothetical protein
MKNTDSVKAYKLTHLLYESKGGEYRITASNNQKAIDAELFAQCYKSVEEILCA